MEDHIHSLDEGGIKALVHVLDLVSSFPTFFSVSVSVSPNLFLQFPCFVILRFNLFIHGYDIYLCNTHWLQQMKVQKMDLNIYLYLSFLKFNLGFFLLYFLRTVKVKKKKERF